MVEKLIRDFVAVVGHGVDDELETFHLFNVNDDPKVKNGMMLFKCRAVDVPVRKSGGVAFWNFVRGKPTVLGKMDLDKDREFSIPQSLVFNIKDGTPSMQLVFPQSFDQLPESFRFHPYLGMALRIAYLSMQNDEIQQQLMEDANLNRTEILDKLSQSQSKANEYMTTMIQSFNQQKTEALKSELEQKKSTEQGFY